LPAARTRARLEGAAADRGWAAGALERRRAGSEQHRGARASRDGSGVRAAPKECRLAVLDAYVGQIVGVIVQHGDERMDVTRARELIDLAAERRDVVEAVGAADPAHAVRQVAQLVEVAPANRLA